MCWCSANGWLKGGIRLEEWIPGGAHDYSMKISVITAVYNAEDTIADAIESVLAQDYSDVELVVIDGASTDGTKDLLELYRDRISAFVSEPDNGIYDALNKGLKHASGDVVGFLHADDLFADSMALSRIADAFATNDCDAVYGDLIYVGRQNPDKVIRYWKSGDYSRNKLKRGWMPPHPTFFAYRNIYEKYGGFDTSFRIAADYDCMLRFLTRANARCVYVPRVLVRMRLGGVSNRSLVNILRKSREDYRALRKHNVGGLGTLLWKNVRKLSQFGIKPVNGLP